MTQVSSTDNTQLARTLGLWAIVGSALGYMTPTVVFDTFGIVSNETGAWFRPPMRSRWWSWCSPPSATAG